MDKIILIRKSESVFF